MLSKALRAISVSYLAMFFCIPDCAYEEIKLCHHIFGASDVLLSVLGTKVHKVGSVIHGREQTRLVTSCDVTLDLMLIL
jgi:hypothetical protein